MPQPDTTTARLDGLTVLPYEHLARLPYSIPTDELLSLRALIEDRSRWRELIKTPMPCVMCASARHRAVPGRQLESEVIESISTCVGPSDRPKRQRSPYSPPVGSIGRVLSLPNPGCYVAGPRTEP